MSIINHIPKNCKINRADLLRQFFNYWTNSGNPAKVIKGRFWQKLRAYNTTAIILFKHITVFALKIARLRNKSVVHGITSIFLYFDISGCLSVCNLFLFGDAQAPTMQGRLYNGVPCLEPFACTACRRYKRNCSQYSEKLSQ